MTLEDSLGHFISCLNTEEQLKHWANIEFFSERGRTCFMFDHKEEIYSLQQYIIKLRNQLDRKD